MNGCTCCGTSMLFHTLQIKYYILQVIHMHHTHSWAPLTCCHFVDDIITRQEGGLVDYSTFANQPMHFYYITTSFLWNCCSVHACGISPQRFNFILMHWDRNMQHYGKWLVHWCITPTQVYPPRFHAWPRCAWQVQCTYDMYAYLAK